MSEVVPQKKKSKYKPATMTTIFFKLSERLGSLYKCTHLHPRLVSVLLGTWHYIFVTDQIELVGKAIYLPVDFSHLQPETLREM